MTDEDEDISNKVQTSRQTIIHVTVPKKAVGAVIGLQGTNIRQVTGRYIRQVTGRYIRHVTGHYIRLVTGCYMKQVTVCLPWCLNQTGNSVSVRV